MRLQYPKLLNAAHTTPFERFTASNGSNFYILFAITVAGIVPCDGPRKSPRASSIVQNYIISSGP